MEKEERKEYVKEQRRKLKEDPSKFIKENVIEPTWKYWKEQPFHAIGTFIMWVAIYYLLFGGIQAINNDMIYCESTVQGFNGKLMYVYNDFVEYYNNEAQQMQQANIPQFYQQEQIVANFNKEYNMYCDYNITKWKEEPIKDRIETTLYGFKKILLKQR